MWFASGCGLGALLGVLKTLNYSIGTEAQETSHSIFDSSLKYT